MTGSAFNVQRSLNIPNLTHDEVRELFTWYEKETNHTVEAPVVDRLYYETNGQPGFRSALEQAAHYGKQLELSEIYLITFVEAIDEKNRQTFEKEYIQPQTGVTVKPVFIQTGNP